MSKIEWCDATINPLGWGCYGPVGTAEKPNICPYCFAKGFAGRGLRDCDLCKKFIPHTHFEQLEKLQQWKKPKTIFVQDMGDLFGDWVPEDWIKIVFKACAAAPQHRYLFLTKNPHRYEQFGEFFDKRTENGLNMELGTSISDSGDACNAYHAVYASWLSVEPLFEDINPDYLGGIFNEDGCEFPRWEWVVVGAETGSRSGKIIPKRRWIQNIVNLCREYNVPVFLKNNLADIWGEPLVQEFPWEVRK